MTIMATGCTTTSRARMNSHDAYIAGQNSVLQQQAAQQQALARMPSVIINGPVQNPRVPWVAGLTLAQALATANYQDPRTPKEIILTRGGESATLDPKILFNGTVVPVEAGDVIDIHP